MDSAQVWALSPSKSFSMAIDLEKESAELKQGLKDSTGQKRARIIKRLEVVEAFRESGQPSGVDDPGCGSR